MRGVIWFILSSVYLSNVFAHELQLQNVTIVISKSRQIQAVFTSKVKLLKGQDKYDIDLALYKSKEDSSLHVSFLKIQADNTEIKNTYTHSFVDTDEKGAMQVNSVFESSLPENAKKMSVVLEKEGGPLFVKIYKKESMDDWGVKILHPGNSMEFNIEKLNLGRFKLALSMFLSGVRHIVPEGLDHIFFLVGLFFGTIGLRNLIIKATWFTLAHAISIWLALFGIVTLPTKMVEILIMLTIAFVGIENYFFRGRYKKMGNIFAVIFGVIHGFGLGNSLSDLRLVNFSPYLTITSFNLGIEFIQTSILMVLFYALKNYFNSEFYNKLILITSTMIVSFSIYNLLIGFTG